MDEGPSRLERPYAPVVMVHSWFQCKPLIRQYCYYCCVGSERACLPPPCCFMGRRVNGRPRSISGARVHRTTTIHKVEKRDDPKQ